MSGGPRDPGDASTHGVPGLDTDTAPSGLCQVSVQELLGRYAAILQELRNRGVVRTANAPLGDYAEYLVAQVYGGELAANSVKSYDLLTTDRRRVQVKACTSSPGSRPDTSRSGTTFSVFRSFDFDLAVLLVFDRATYELEWARQVDRADIQAASRVSRHVNGHLLTAAVAAQLGVDVTSRFRAALSCSCRARTDPAQPA